MQLNPEQKQAVEHKRGPLLIVAGAGSGKTRTITERIINLIKEGVPATKILAITFTNKAAKEMKERVRKRVFSDDFSLPVSDFGIQLPEVLTFHALSVKILREFGKILGFQKNFTIADRDDSIKEIKNAMKSLGFDPKIISPSYTLGYISKLKNSGKTIKDIQNSPNPKIRDIALIWEKYSENLKNAQTLDFDDLLVYAVERLKNKDVREALQSRWEYIHVDEYQDTNDIQFELIKKLVGKEKNICVVGDVDQSIYTWRSAKPENLLEFEKHFPGTQTVILKHNYRSTETILCAADDVIAKNTKRFQKEIISTIPGGEKITVISAISAQDEALSIVKEAKKQHEKGVPWENMAVLFRANFQSRALEEAFLSQGVPYQVLGIKFYQRKEIKDLISYLKASLNPKSVIDISRVVATPPRGIGKKTLSAMIQGDLSSISPSARLKVEQFFEDLKQIKEFALANKLSATLEFIIKKSGIEEKYKHGSDDEKERLENMYELVSVAKKYDNIESKDAIDMFLEEVALSAEQDSLAESKPGVKLMTVHASKGLEFDTVFISGLEEGLFPHEKLEDDDVDEEEERRLMYVAITRAQRKLYLSYAFTRSLYGKTQVNTPSSFIDDISEDLLEKQNNMDTQRKVPLIDLDDIEF